MIGRIVILIIGHLFIPLMRGMSICLLKSFPGSCGKKSVCTHRVLQRNVPKPSFVVPSHSHLEAVYAW